MSTAESLPPTPDASLGEPTSTNPRFPEGGWALYAVDGDGETTSNDAVAPETHDDVIKTDVDTVGEAEVAPDRTDEAGSLDKPETDPSAEESDGKRQDDGAAEGGDDGTEQKTAPSSPNMTRRLAIKIGAGVAAVVTGIVGIVAATSNHDASPAPTPTIAGSKTPGPSATETATAEPTPTESVEQGDDLKELGLPSIEEFQGMTLKEQTAVIENALPKSLLDQPDTVYRTFIGLEELIYNAPASDDLYKKYRDEGGVDYPTYVMDRFYKPLFKKLTGKEPSTNLDDNGPYTFAYRVANIENVRMQGSTDIFPTPYRVTMGVASVEPLEDAGTLYDIHGMIFMGDTIDAAQAEALANLKDFHVNVLDKSKTVGFSMLSVHFSKEENMIRASRLE